MRKLLLSMMLLMVFGMLANAQQYQIALSGKGPKAQVLNSDFERLNMEFSFSNLNGFDIKNNAGNFFTEINLDEAYSVGAIGTPNLPAVKKLIEIPFGAEISVKVLDFKEEEFKLSDYGISNPLMPAQPSLRKDQDPNMVPFEYNAEAYSKNDYSNRPLASVEILGVMRGVRIARLVIAPVDYNPGKGEIKVYNDVKVQVTFRNSDVDLTNEMFEKTYSPYFEAPYSKLVNYNFGGKNVFDDHPDLTKYPVKYLIVAARMFEATLQPFIQWKTKQGFKVVVAYTDVIGTTAAAIKTYIHAQYAAGTPTDPAPTFFVLVGDTPQIPASATGSESGRATDLYYASMTTDYFPEMYYARLSATTVPQLQNQLDKILYYQKYEFTDPTYLNRTTLIAGADGTWNPAVAQPTIQYGTQNFFNAAHGFTTVNSYLTSPYTGCYSAEKIAVSFINYTAHCSETSWGDPGLSISDVNAFTNTGKYPLAIGNCCLAADFGYDQCMGETWMRAANKGAVAYIGSSPSSYWFEDFYWSVGAFPIVGNNNGHVPTLAETTLGAYEAPFASDYVSVDAMLFAGNLAVTEVDIQGWPQHSTPTYYWQGYNCMGDPSTFIYLTEGQDNSVTHLPIVPIGLNTYTVSAVPGSYVAISKDGVLHGAALVDASGEVVVPIEPIVAGGNVDIVVTKPQYKPYMVQVPAAALEGPYIVLDSYTINDATGGNNNQIAEYGETIKLNVTLKNVGADPGNNINATISGTDAFVSISGTATQSFGTISATAGSNTALVNNAYTLVISNAIPDQHMATFVITITNGTTTWTSNLKVTVNAPELEVGEMTIDDGGAGIPSVLDAGETANVVIAVTNTGHAALNAVSATLNTANPIITINTTSAVSLGDIGVGESKSASFSVTASASAPLESPVDVNFSVTGGQYHATDTKTIIIGLIPSYSMSAGTITACIGRFYDSGGLDGEYGNNENIVTTIAPATAGNIIQVVFSSFETESGYDYLYIYNGANESAPQVAGSPFHGTGNPGTIMALNESGKLTFKFHSDGSSTRSGWEALFSCADVSNPPTPASNPVPANNASGVNPLSPLGWASVSGAFSYDVYFGVTLPETPTANVVNASYAPTMLANTTYVWKIVPKNNAGAATGCATWTFTTGDMPTVINMSNTPVTTCNALFYDPQGANADYLSNLDYTQTFNPASESANISVTFSEFETESSSTCSYDYLEIFDGSTTSATLIGKFCGTNNPGTVTATNGSLTFHFHSDGSVVKMGWAAVVSCISTITYPVTFMVTDSSDVTIPDAVIRFDGTAQAAGDYVMEAVSPGTHFYTVSKEGYVNVSGSIEVIAEMTVTVVLEPLCIVTFVVTDSSDVVINDAIITFNGVAQTTGDYTIDGVPAGTYAYIVSKEGYEDVSGSVDVNGNITVDVKIDWPLGIHPNHLNMVRVYPNPFTNYLTFQNAGELSTVVISNTLGQQFINFKASGHTHFGINTAELVKGIYVVSLTDKNGNSIKYKLVKE